LHIAHLIGTFTVQPASILKGIIAEDLKSTGKCRLTIAKEDFLSLLASFATPKGSSITPILNDG
jgi:hypothetical protein